jgi:hypothetical protein
MKRNTLAAWLTAAAIALPGWAQASVWFESGPTGAGDLLNTAQITSTSGTNALTGISGSLTASVPVGGGPLYQVDLYQIRIGDFTTFSARTLDTGFDTALYLFNATGFGVYMNDDMPDFSALTSLLPSGDASGPMANGLYFLAVALGGFVAEDLNSLSLFLAGGFNDVLGSDPAAGMLAGWSSGFESTSESPLSYFIELTGATGAELPEPGTAGLLLAAALGLWATARARTRSSSVAAVR